MPITRPKHGKRLGQRRTSLNDRQLAQLGRKYKKHQQVASTHEKARKELGKQIVAEFDARGTHLLENDGVRVTDTIQMRTVYDFDEIERRVGKKRAQKFQKREVDLVLLSQAIQADPELAAVAADCSHEVEHARYPSISFPRV